MLSYNQIEISEGEKSAVPYVALGAFIQMEPTCQPDVSHNSQSISLFPKGFIKSVSAWVLFLGSGQQINRAGKSWRFLLMYLRC